MSLPSPGADTFIPGPEFGRIVFLTGAGLSARAGLPTFRGPEGMWSLHPDLERAMHADALPESLNQLWAVWPRVFAAAARSGPTPGHRAIARMGGHVITQNIDGLHQLAGSADVAELHGSAGRAVCLDAECTWSAELQIPAGPEDSPRPEDHGAPARCPRCASRTRPDVVLFDELLPEAALARAEQLTEQAELFVVVGTSGLVFPAAQLAPTAHRHGAITVLIDIDPVDPVGARSRFDHVIVGDAHEVLPRWERARAGRSDTHPFLDPFG